MKAPSIWARMRSGLTLGPQSTAMSAFGIETSPLSLIGFHRHGDAGHEAVMARNAKTMAFGQCAAPTYPRGCSLDHGAKPSRIDRVTGRVLAMIPLTPIL
jgi:hypothetical protein